jgi:hypothetical protein
MITFYHCVDARLFHALWALEEVGVPRTQDAAVPAALPFSASTSR